MTSRLDGFQTLKPRYQDRWKNEYLLSPTENYNLSEFPTTF